MIQQYTSLPITLTGLELTRSLGHFLKSRGSNRRNSTCLEPPFALSFS